jgi:hypothetical protein
MKIKTNELTGAALDWAVALIEFPAPGYEDDDRLVYVLGDDEFHFTPSTNWSQGGPITERERIDLYFIGHDAVDNGLPIWRAEKLGEWGEEGPTPLVAAMRCYVGSVMGNEVEVPDELTEVAA